MTKRIIVINGHSIKNSFCESIARSYIQGAKESKAEIKFINLYDLKFDPVFISKKKQPLEKNLKHVQESIKWADHIVFVYPLWWGDMPALMKGFLDRAFIPGFAYDPKNKTMGLPKGLLKGKSARAIITMGAPLPVYKLIFRKPATKIINIALKYCGIKPVRTTHFGKIDSSTEQTRKQILSKVKHLGSKLQ
ncbi:NAD(P)H-dependent oxidoreductase [Candidatus Woesearchaeota archaeon]|nr:NAD(P)H-dependent oxidoreductase [Candidatus Woesearchaeota archaeon]